MMSGKRLIGEGVRAVRSRRFLGIAMAFALATLPVTGGGGAAPEPPVETCLANDTVVPLTGTYESEVRYSSPTEGTTFDARDATFLAYPFKSTYPYSLGKRTAPRRLCSVGGLVLGQQSVSLTWDQMKNKYDGDGLRMGGNDWYVVDGLRVDNVEDGVAPRGTEDLYPKDGDGFVLRNLYFTYIRDDCIENDDIAGGIIYDSLFDGCYTGISERPSDGSPQWKYPAPAGETLTLDHVLLRLQAMPGPRGTNDPSVLGHGQLFKWSDVANTPVVRNSVFLVESTPNSPSYFPFPAGTVTENVTIVWGGVGPFTWPVPPGTTVTTDRSVWDDARAGWLTRHGCTSFLSCTKLHAPDPIGQGPAPTGSPTPPGPSPSPSVSPSPTPTTSASPTACPIPKKGKACRR